MPNTYFQFKQFTIHQQNCAMKVSTDSCLFGAWFAKKDLRAQNILDVGSGTGLLMLMLAQKQDSGIFGIEIDPKCFEQLQENIHNSKWQERLTVFPGDVRSFKSEIKFDFIISNPPFYENSLKAEANEANLARHSKELSLEELISSTDALLAQNGHFGVLLPYQRTAHFEKLAAQKGFHLLEKLIVKQTPSHEYFRSILHYSRTKSSSISQKELVIVKGEGEYTEEFIQLLKDYYLYL